MFGRRKTQEPEKQESLFEQMPPGSGLREEKVKAEQPSLYLGSLDEEGAHSWARMAFWKWMFDTGWEAFFPGMAKIDVIAPVKKAIALKIIEVVEAAGQTKPDDPESIYVPILTKMDFWRFSKDQETALKLIARASSMVAKRGQGWKEKYEAEEDILRPPRKRADAKA